MTLEPPLKSTFATTITFPLFRTSRHALILQCYCKIFAVISRIFAILFSGFSVHVGIQFCCYVITFLALDLEVACTDTGAQFRYWIGQ